MNEDEVKNLILKYGERAMLDYKNEKIDGLTGGRVDNYLSMLSGYSAMLEEEMGKLEMIKATEWLGLRNLAKSNVDADRAWDATDNGLRYIQLSRLLRAVDKIISACKQRLKRLENESYNRY